MLSRRWLLNGALAILIGGLVLLGYHDNRDSDTETSEGVLDFGAETVDHIEIRIADKRFQLHRDEDEWLLDHPVQWPANRFNVEHLLQITEAQTESSFPVEGLDLAQFGLSQPSALMILNNTIIAFGISHNIGERRYARIGQTVYLLPDVYLPFLSQGIVALIDRRLLPPSLALQSLRLGQIELQRESEDNWRVTSGGPDANDRAGQLIANWRNLEATRLRSIDTALQPILRVQVKLENGETFEFQVLSLSPELVIAQPALGLQFHFETEQYQQLLSLPDETAS